MHVIDLGNRCTAHAGEAFPVRCSDCATETETLRTFAPWLCPTHPAHFRPCSKGCDD